MRLVKRRLAMSRFERDWLWGNGVELDRASVSRHRELSERWEGVGRGKGDQGNTRKDCRPNWPKDDGEIGELED